MPSDPDTNGRQRDGKGRYVPGHKGTGAGGPYCHKLATWRAAFMRAVTPADVEAIVKNLVASARAGEKWAVELLLDRTLGKSPVAADVDFEQRLAEVERKLDARQREADPAGSPRRF